MTDRWKECKKRRDNTIVVQLGDSLQVYQLVNWDDTSTLSYVFENDPGNINISNKMRYHLETRIHFVRDVDIPGSFENSYDKVIILSILKIFFTI